MADGTKAKVKPASNTAHDRTASKVLAEQHAEATRTHRRVAADCGYAARLRAQSGARQGLMRGEPSAKPPRSSAAAPDSVRGENKLSTRFDGGEGAGRRPEVISITAKHVT
jgi:hypothetical protein